MKHFVYSLSLTALLLISCSFLTTNMPVVPSFEEPEVAWVSNNPILDDPTRFPAFVGIPFDEESQSATGRLIVPAPDVAPGVVRGTLEDGTAYIGSPDAPIVLAEFSDFSCPHCAEYSTEVERIITELVRTGQARYEFHMVTFVGGQFSEIAAEAAFCAGEQGAFWEFRSFLFDIQRNESREAFNFGRMETAAIELWLDNDLFSLCMNSNRPASTLAADELLRTELDINSAPTVIYRPADSNNWQFFTDENGERATRGSFEEVRALVESFQ